MPPSTPSATTKPSTCRSRSSATPGGSSRSPASRASTRASSPSTAGQSSPPLRCESPHGRGSCDRSRRGAISFPIAATFPFEQAAEALTLVASGRAGGKVILVVG
ncbi:zinc-binding dehydrogenase [Pseudoclavibacter helvolus]|uniref:zinc-binding dehydrogenase n=1 Tax=Pseudoclavibacter helvolus TaxID=255205 RepID=UPI0037350EEA